MTDPLDAIYANFNSYQYTVTSISSRSLMYLRARFHFFQKMGVKMLQVEAVVFRRAGCSIVKTIVKTDEF